MEKVYTQMYHDSLLKMNWARGIGKNSNMPNQWLNTKYLRAIITYQIKWYSLENHWSLEITGFNGNTKSSNKILDLVSTKKTMVWVQISLTAILNREWVITWQRSKGACKTLRSYGGFMQSNAVLLACYACLTMHLWMLQSMHGMLRANSTKD